MQAKCLRKLAIFAVALGMAAMGGGLSAQDRRTDDSRTRTPIKHVVVIFQENVSFDHYFGTYPHAANLPDETVFRSQDDTPRVNNLLSAGLLEFNPNGVNPFRIPPKFAVTCDEDHNYNDEQFAFHAGLMDRFTATLPSGSPFYRSSQNIGRSSKSRSRYCRRNSPSRYWVPGPIVNQSNVTDDQLLGAGSCGTPKASNVGGVNQNGRCGYGPRLPLMVISPWAKKNYIDHRVTDQSSILRFIEDNWDLGRIGNGSTDAIAGTLEGMFDFDDAQKGSNRRVGKLILNPDSGQIVDDDSR